MNSLMVISWSSDGTSGLNGLKGVNGSNDIGNGERGISVGGGKGIKCVALTPDQLSLYL